jgi:hypothetical protein
MWNPYKPVNGAKIRQSTRILPKTPNFYRSLYTLYKGSISSRENLHTSKIDLLKQLGTVFSSICHHTKRLISGVLPPINDIAVLIIALVMDITIAMFDVNIWSILLWDDSIPLLYLVNEINCRWYVLYEMIVFVVIYHHSNTVLMMQEVTQKTPRTTILCSTLIA